MHQGGGAPRRRSSDPCRSGRRPFLDAFVPFVLGSASYLGPWGWCSRQLGSFSPIQTVCNTGGRIGKDDICSRHACATLQ